MSQSYTVIGPTLYREAPIWSRCSHARIVHGVVGLEEGRYIVIWIQIIPVHV